MIPENELLDRLQRLHDAAARFKRNDGGRGPGLRAELAERYILSGHLVEAGHAILTSESEIRTHELRDLAMKTGKKSPECFREVMSVISNRDYARAEEMLIAAGALD